MKKKVSPAIILAILLLVVGFAAYFVWRNGNTAPPSPLPAPDQTGDSSPGSGATVEVTLYFANDRYVLTGDANEPRVISEKRMVRPGTRSIPEVVMEELVAGPEKEGLSTVLTNLKVLSAEVREGIAYVNFDSTNLNGGSLTETLLIEQTVRSLTELKGVQAVQFLVDGQKEESLMGHILATDPIRP